MRILFHTTPTFSHTTPLIPLAHAARLAGHEVLLASGDVALKTAAGAGIPVFDVAPGTDVSEPRKRFEATVDTASMSQQEAMGAFFGMLAQTGDLMLPGLVDVARSWEADAILYPAWCPWSMLAARAAGAISVMHSPGLRWPSIPFMASEPPEVVRRHGVTEFPAHPDAEINLAPHSLERFNPNAPAEVPFPVLDMRPATYNGSGEVPLWALTAPSRPRILVTMGSADAGSGWAAVLRAIIDGTADLDAELVLTLGGEDLPADIELPDRVRVVDFVPLSHALPRCSALVHHGGMGSMFAALAVGVPQVILPINGGDATINGHVLSSRGAGLVVDPAEISPETVGKAVRDLLQVPSYRSTSEDVSGELAAMPDPGDVVGRLAELVAKHKG